LLSNYTHHPSLATEKECGFAGLRLYNQQNMSNAKSPELFPVALGNEEESMLLTGRDMAHLRDPEEFVGAFQGYLPPDIARVGEAGDIRSIFLQNGGKMYDGGAIKETEHKRVTVKGVNLERTTPECSGPKEVAAYIESSERLYVNMLRNYVEHWAELGDPRVARAQRRVISTNMQTRASHDNIEIRRKSLMHDLNTEDEQQDNMVVNALHTFLASRSFITGAGYVNRTGSFYAQKASSLQTLEGYGYWSTAYRTAQADTGARLEVRCNDVNISPWAIQARIGGAALYTTLLQTELVNSVASFVPTIEGVGDIFGMYRRFNVAPFTADGELIATRAVRQAIDIQDRVWGLFGDELGNFVDIPDEYQTLINEVRYYIEDFRKVASGAESISSLADRSDMAAKFTSLLERWRQNPHKDARRALGDVESMANDLKYDLITLEPVAAGGSRTTYGFGMQLRNKGKFRLPLKPINVERAYYRPPSATR
jgi:hypothetical protein